MNFALVIFVSHMSRNHPTDIGDFTAGNDPGDIEFHSIVVLLDNGFPGNSDFHRFFGQGEGRHAGERQQGKSFHWIVFRVFGSWNFDQLSTNWSKVQRNTLR